MPKIKVEKQQIKEEKKAAKEEKKVAELEEQLAKLKADVEHWKNEYYRAYADTQNLRKSLEKEHSDIIKYRAMGFIEDLLPVLDSFHMALANEPTSQELKNYLVGFQFVYRNLVNVLENEGVKEIAPNIGDKFSDKSMNAVDITVQEGEENLVTKVYAKGYELHGRLIRPAQVSVSKNKKEEEPKESVKADA
jgi:molecular chaperone GrpE